MKTRIFRIMLCFGVWLIPVGGIYLGAQVLHNGLGIVLAIISSLLLMPLIGILFDAITNDNVLHLNVYHPWKSHLGSTSDNER